MLSRLQKYFLFQYMVFEQATCDAEE